MNLDQTISELPDFTCPQCSTNYSKIAHVDPLEPGCILNCPYCETDLIIVPDGVRVATMEEIKKFWSSKSPEYKDRYRPPLGVE